MLNLRSTLHMIIFINVQPKQWFVYTTSLIKMVVWKGMRRVMAIVAWGGGGDREQIVLRKFLSLNK